MQTLRKLALIGRIPVSTPADHEDQAVEAAARSRLCSTGYASVGRVGCRFDDGTLVLSGNVTSYYQKQIAQTAVMSLSGIDRVVNEIKVRNCSRRPLGR